MKFVKIIKDKIKVEPLFYISSSILIALGFLEQFFIMLIVVTLHESAHIVTAKIFKCKLNELVITPLGEIANIKEIEYLSSLKKILIYISGPLLNLFLWCATFLIFKNKYEVFKIYNLAVFFINLVPMYPLDGGRILQTILGETYGILMANRFISRLSKIICIILILLGMLQVVLYPFNISLLCIGVYFFKYNKQEYLKMTYNFYKMIFSNNEKLKKSKIIKVKSYTITKDIKVKNLLNKICWDYFFMAYIIDNGQIIGKITENQIISYIEELGANGTAENIRDFIENLSYTINATDDILYEQKKSQISDTPPS